MKDMENQKGLPGTPAFEHGEELTPLDLNGIKLDDKHTVLTPRKLESMVE